MTGTLDVLNSYRVISKINGVVNRWALTTIRRWAKGSCSRPRIPPKSIRKCPGCWPSWNARDSTWRAPKADIETKKDLFQGKSHIAKELEQAELKL